MERHNEQEVSELMRTAYRQTGGPAPRGPSCPSPEELGAYEASLRSGEADEGAVGIIQHIADCPACAALIADMQGDEDEAPAGVVLRSSTKAWQEKMLTRIARELGGETRRSWIPAWNWSGWAAVAAGLVFVAGGLWWNAARNSPARAFNLIAQAYAEQRPFEFRIPGAAHSPMRAERGALDSPGVPLLEAQGLIAEKIQKEPDGADWLRASARADLVRWRYASAIESLRRAEATEPDNPAILGDLGLAYLQRAEIESRPQDIAQAVEYLSKAVDASPSEPAYRFNLALAYERQTSFQQALEQWNGLLGIEKSGAWADEARQHVARIQETLKKRAGGAAPRTSEDAILALAASGFRSTASLDARAVAADLGAKHGDPWMQDFLNASGNQQSQPAINALEQAAKSYATDHASEGVDRSREAAELFRRAHNVPGALFAAVGQAFGYQRLSQSQPCLEVAGAALPAAHSRSYRWIEARLDLTLAGCLITQRSFDRANQATVTAQAIAEKAGYASLSLQSLFARAENLRTLGSYREAIVADAEGLRRYWSGAGNATYGYELYYDMGMAAGGLHDLRDAAALLNEAVDLATRLPNRMVEAMARSRLAGVLLEDGRTREADDQFAKSEAAFRGMPQTADARLYSSYAEVSMARLDGRENQVSKGLERIDRLEPALQDIGSPSVEALLWGVKSELLIRAGRTSESEAPLRRILVLGASERNRSSNLGDSSELAREVSQAVGTLTEHELERGDAARAWRLWTDYNSCFRTIPGGGADDARLLFTELPSGPVAWISDESGIVAEKLRISNQELERLAANFRRAVSNPQEPLSRIRSMAQSMYGYVFAPLENRLQHSHVLYIAADGAFASIPFAALTSEDGRWLGDRYRVVYSPPITGAPAASPAALSQDPHVVAAGYGQAAEILQTVFPPLPEVDADMSAISGALPHSALLPKATVSAVLRALPDAGILHFSGHSLVTAGDAALVLAPGDGANPERLLWASQIPPQSLRSCRLVMLAACSTGRAAGEDNDPSSVMARTFLLKGVPQVIASRWDVDSSATSFLVARFYHALAKGASAEEALSSSVVQLRRQPAFAHPYFWAAFDLFRS